MRWLADPASVGLAASGVPVGKPIQLPARLAERAREVPVDDDGEPLIPVVDRVDVHRRYAELPFKHLPAEVRLRRTVLAGLTAARDALPAPFSLVVIDGWRSLAFQTELLAYYAQRHESVAGFVSDPADASLLPPHVTGAAVDLTLAYAGQPLALGTDFDAFVPEAAIDWFEAPSAVRAPSDELTRRLRRLLAGVLDAQGFAPLAEEWWHWSFGDQRWAVCRGAGRAPYGLVTGG